MTNNKIFKLIIYYSFKILKNFIGINYYKYAIIVNIIILYEILLIRVFMSKYK